MTTVKFGLTGDPSPPALLTVTTRRVLAIVTAALMVVYTAVGLADVRAPQVVATLLNPDLEGGVPAVHNALLLIAVGVLGIRLRRYSGAFALLGAGVIAMALDEVLGLHELLEAGSDTDWQILYAPVAVLALPVLLRVFRRMRHAAAAAVPLLAVGLGFWAASQVLEFVQWDGVRPVSGYLYLMVAEENLELSGTLMVLFALQFTAAKVQRIAHAPTGVGRQTSDTPRSASQSAPTSLGA